MSVDLLYVLNKRKVSVEDWLQTKNICSMEDLLEFQRAQGDYKLSEEFMDGAKKVLCLEPNPVCDTVAPTPAVPRTTTNRPYKHAKLQTKSGSETIPVGSDYSDTTSTNNNDTSSEQ